MVLIPQQLKTYAQVLTIAREIERGLIRKEKSQVREDMMKKSFLKENNKMPVMHPTNPSLTKRPHQFPQQAVCGHCQRPVHTRNICRVANGLCLTCGSGNRSLSDSPFRGTGNTLNKSTISSTPYKSGTTSIANTNIVKNLRTSWQESATP